MKLNLISRTTRLWATKRTRPRVVKQQQFEYAYLFGSVCPTKGIGEAMVVPLVNKDIMINHLEQTSELTKKGLHTDDIANQFTNLSIIKLPPYSSELNPIEQVWSSLRQYYLGYQSFIDYNGIVSKIYSAWNENKEHVPKMCKRDWINITS